MTRVLNLLLTAIHSCYIMPLRIISALSSFGKTLNDISIRHAVGLYWVPGHARVPGNEIADKLARDGCALKFVGPEPILGVSRQDVRIRHWLVNQHWVWWRGLGNTQTGSRINFGTVWVPRLGLCPLTGHNSGLLLALLGIIP